MSTESSSPYQSFWMGGFEGADHINAKQDRLDMVQGSGHDVHLKEDYSRLSQMGIRTVRESIGWRTVRPTLNDAHDVTRILEFAKAAKREGIQIIWTFMHYGTPEGVTLEDDSFIDHFVDYAVKMAHVLKPFSKTPIFNLINEISYLSWAVAHTDFMHPYRDPLDGYEIKQRLVKAVVKAATEIKKMIPGARFLHVEPIMHVAAPIDKPELTEEAEKFKSYQWQTFDLLWDAGMLDLIGVNYYYNGQIEFNGEALCWKTPDPRRIPFSKMLEAVWERYGQPLIISETGHFDDERAKWLDEVLGEVKQALDAGIPVQGVCIYPILDRPCWHDPDMFIRTGLIQATDEGRKYHLGSAKTILRWQQELE